MTIAKSLKFSHASAQNGDTLLQQQLSLLSIVGLEEIGTVICRSRPYAHFFFF